MLPLRWLYLDMNSFFASVHQQLRPELRGRPIAVGPEAVDSGTIIAASYPAKAFGVRTGMRVGDAKRLCPGLIFVGGGHEQYVRFHDRIVAEVWRHLPVHQVCSIDEVACRLLDNENGPADARALARRIKAGIARNVGEALTCSIGIGPSRLVAKIAADMVKPDGLTLIESHELPQRLYGLSLSDIPGVGRRMRARLTMLGITSMRDLLGQDPRAAGSAWGSVVGLRMWWALHGVDQPDRPAQSRSIGHSHVLAPQARDPETVRLTARRLLVKAAARLRRAGCVARHLVLAARFESAAGWHVQRRIPPTDDSFVLLAALDALWPELAGRLHRERVRTIAVSLPGLEPAVGLQLHLFETEGAHPRHRALAAALDRLNGRYARELVTIGPPPTGRARLIGSKIAFGRIPDIADYSGN